MCCLCCLFVCCNLCVREIVKHEQGTLRVLFVWFVCVRCFVCLAIRVCLFVCLCVFLFGWLSVCFYVHLASRPASKQASMPARSQAREQAVVQTSCSFRHPSPSVLLLFACSRSAGIVPSCKIRWNAATKDPLKRDAQPRTSSRLKK